MTKSDCPVDSQGEPAQKLVTHSTLTIPVRVTKENRITKSDCPVDSQGIPVAVPDQIFGLALFLDLIDRCHSLPSLLPPPAAFGSLPSS